MEPKKTLKKHNIVKPKSIFHIYGNSVQGTTYEPTRMTRRHVIEIVLDGRSYEAYAMVDFIYEIDRAVVPLFGSATYRLPIRRELSINIKFRDTINCSYGEMVRAISVGDRFNMKIMELDPSGITVNEKRCYNCFLSSLTFGDGTWDNLIDIPLDINQIECSVKCDSFDETFS